MFNSIFITVLSGLAASGWAVAFVFWWWNRYLQSQLEVLMEYEDDDDGDSWKHNDPETRPLLPVNRRDT